MLSSLLLSAVCSGLLATEPTEAAAVDPVPLPSAVEQLDQLWARRDEAEALKRVDDTLKLGLKGGEDYEVLWRAARFRWWVADCSSSEKLKKQVAKEGWLYAERALKVSPKGGQAKYYLALNIGAYSQGVGILQALGEGLEGKFLENLHASMAIDDGFDRMGAHTAKGRYWFELPWPKRDLSKSTAELELVTAKHPEHLRAWLFLSETLLKEGKISEAKQAIDRVQTGSVDYDPPEGRYIKSLTKPVADAVAARLK